MQEIPNTRDIEMTADEAIAINIREYGLDTLQTKIPHVVDGLKPIHRRIMYEQHSRDDWTKSVAMTGAVLEKYHVAGDNSVNDAIAHMCMPYVHIVPLLFAETNIGDYDGGEAAQPRYLKVRKDPLADHIYFGTTEDSSLTMEISATEKYKEPQYLIPSIPMALVTGGFGLAIGFKTSPVTLCLGDVCKLSIEFIKLFKRYGTTPPFNIACKELGQFMVPDTPIAGLVRNEEELINSFKMGNFNQRIVRDGCMDITAKSIILTTLPYGKNFRDTYDMLLGLKEAKDENLINKFVDQLSAASSSIVSGRIECTVKRGISPFEILEQLKKLIGFTGTDIPINRFVHVDKTCKLATPLEVLDIWYKERHRSVLAGYKATQRKLVTKLWEIRGLIIIHSDLDKAIAIFRKSQNTEEAAAELCREFKLTLFQANFVSKLTLAQITRTAIEDLKKDEAGTQVKINELSNKMIKIDEMIISTIEDIKNKWVDKYPRKCITPDFIGSVRMDNGHIQFRTINELDLILSRLGTDIETMLYPSGAKNKILVYGHDAKEEGGFEFPKEFIANDFQVLNRKPRYSICLRKSGKDRTICAVPGVDYSKDEDLDITYVGDQFTYVDTDSKVWAMDTNKLPVRKAIGLGNLTEINSVHSVVADEVYVVHINSNEPNIVRMNKIKTNGQKYGKIPIGNTRILGMYKTGTEFLINIPRDHLNRLSHKPVIVIRSSEVASSVTIDLSKRVVSDGRKVIKFTTNLVELK